MKRREFIARLGSAVAWPRAAGAQQKTLAVIGYLHFASPQGLFAAQPAALRQGLSEIGFMEGQNISIDYRWAEGIINRVPALASDLVRRKVDVIVAIGPPCAHAAKDATSTIPIVFAIGTDPVADGLIDSLARPGGNLTGVSMLAVDLSAKRLDLLSELLPQAREIALLVNPNNENLWISDLERAAREKGMQLHISNASTESEIDAAFANFVKFHADALVVGDDVFFTSRREQLVALTSRYSIPAIERWREFAASGGLMSYGPSLTGVNHQLGIYVGRILKGEKPSDLPVQQPTQFEFVINLKTAKDLGVNVPPTLLARADEVIE